MKADLVWNVMSIKCAFIDMKGPLHMHMSSLFDRFLALCAFGDGWLLQFTCTVHVRSSKFYRLFFVKSMHIELKNGFLIKIVCKYYVSSPLKMSYKEIQNWNKTRKEQIGIKEPFLWPICHLLHKDKVLLASRNNFRATKKFLIAKFDCNSEYFPKTSSIWEMQWTIVTFFEYKGR